jgi:hypothetical protein
LYGPLPGSMQLSIMPSVIVSAMRIARTTGQRGRRMPASYSRGVAAVDETAEFPFRAKRARGDRAR